MPDLIACLPAGRGIQKLDSRFRGNDTLNELSEDFVGQVEALSGQFDVVVIFGQQAGFDLLGHLLFKASEFFCFQAIEQS